MSSYVEVPKQEFAKRLEAAGFVLAPEEGEVAYRRVHRVDPDLQVLVLTSVPKSGEVARGVGEDAVRILVLARTASGRNRCLWKCRVNRVTSVEGVLERTMERAREGYEVLNQAIIARRAADPEYARLDAARRRAASKPPAAVSVVRIGPGSSPQEIRDAKNAFVDRMVAIADKHHGGG